MSNWEIVTPAFVDTGTPVSQKWRNTVPVTPVQKVRLGISVPSFNISNNYGAGYRRMPFNVPIGQFNYTAPQPFTFDSSTLGQPQSLNLFLSYFVISYLKNGVKTRYIINPLNPSAFEVNYLAAGQPYTGQVILPNFSIEVWLGQNPNETGFIGFGGGVLSSSILLVSTPFSDIAQPNMSPVGGIVTNDLFVNLPLNLPYNWPADTIWLSN